MTAPFDRSTPPLAGKLRGFRFPEFLHTRLTNGLELYLARWPYFPLASMQLLLPGGAQHCPPDLAGLASLHAGMLDEGTETRTALDISSSIEGLGGFLGTGADWDVAYMASTVLATHIEAALELFCDMAWRPSFPQHEIERLKRHRLAEILRAKGQPTSLADRRFARTVFAGTHYAAPLIGSEESVRALTRERFIEFNRRYMSPHGASLIVVGDVDPEALARRLEEIFGAWPEPYEEVVSPGIVPTPLEGLEIHVVDRPGSSQTHLQMGHGGIRRDDPDHTAGLVMNAILGAKFTSRLNLSLREKHGITYGTYSQFIFRQGVGPYFVRLGAATESVGIAVEETIHEMRRLREEPVPESELAETQDFLVGAFPITLQTVSDLAKRLEVMAVYGLPQDYYVGYPDVLRDLTSEDVLAASRRLLHPDRMAVVAVGPAEQLRPQLEKLGPVKVWTP